MTDMKKQSRREFLRTAGLSGAFLTSGAAASLLAGPQLLSKKASTAKPAAGTFKLKYAPPFGMFEASAGKDPWTR